jgi:hypothetical protein
MIVTPTQSTLGEGHRRRRPPSHRPQPCPITENGDAGGWMAASLRVYVCMCVCVYVCMYRYVFCVRVCLCVSSCRLQYSYE